ncbi:MAG: hypothetical protein JOY97_13540 [Hyphomicrobiales bacterium]|nr:hypothetical protein [Hyphomicrobiales bacterium]
MIHRIQERGVAWFGGVTWRGMRVMRVSVCNYLTQERDIDQAVASVREALADRGCSADGSRHVHP